MQLIYGGKTNQSLLRFKFPESFSLSVNPKHYSNTLESIKIINKVIIPYVNAQREILSNPNQAALLISMCFAVRLQMKLPYYYKTIFILLQSLITWHIYSNHWILTVKLSLQCIDPFNDIAPSADSLSEGSPGNFVKLSDDLREGYMNELDENKSEDDEDTEWGTEDDFIIDDE